MVSLVVFVLVFSAANRFAGGGLGWGALTVDHGGVVRGRPIYYVGALAVPALYFLYGLGGALAGASFVLWRLPGWYGAIDAGTFAGTPARDWRVMFLRTVFAFPVFLWSAIERGPATLLVWPLLAAWIATSYHLAAHAGALKRIGGAAEYLAGMGWGLALWALLAV